MKAFSAYALEMLYACVFVVPAAVLAVFLKEHEKRDAYDVGVNYNPFSLD